MIMAIERLNRGIVVEQYVAHIVGTLRAADSAGDGLDREDVALMRAQQQAQARAILDVNPTEAP